MFEISKRHAQDTAQGTKKKAAPAHAGTASTLINNYNELISSSERSGLFDFLVIHILDVVVTGVGSAVAGIGRTAALAACTGSG